MSHGRRTIARAALSVIAATSLAAAAAPASATSALAPPGTLASAEPACDSGQALGTAVPALQPGADLLCSLASLPLTYVTVYDPPGADAPIRRLHTGVVNVPTPLDIGDTFAPDLVATLSVLGTGGASLRVTRAPSLAAPASLPASVEAVVRVPQSGERTAAVGYDALASNAPQSFDGAFSFQGHTTSVTSTTAGAGASLEVTGELFTPGPGDARTDPQRVRAGFAPVPTTASFAVTADDAAPHITATATAPTVVDIDAEDRTGSRAMVIDARIDRLPRSLSADLADGASGAKSLRYRASAPVARVDAHLLETDGSAILQEVLLDLEGLPTEVDIAQPGPESVELTANAPIAVAEAAFARGGSVRTLDPVANPAYAYVFEQGAVSSRALRALGVQRAAVAMSDGLSLQATLHSSPFRVLLEDGARTMDGVVGNLPSQVDMSYSPADGRVEYSGSAAMGEIVVAAADPDGLLGRATNVELLLEGLPQALMLDFSQTGDTIAVDAHGARIGLIEFTATNGPTATVPGASDGLQLIDRGAPYLLFGRMTGVRSATATLAPDPHLFVDSVGGRSFEVDLRTGPDTYMTATLDPLRPGTRIRVLPHGSERWKLSYVAANPAARLDFSTNGDDESDSMTARLEPVPTSIEVCSSNDTACNQSGGAGANAGAVSVVASSPTTVNLFSCDEPLQGCSRANATAYTDVVDLIVQVARFDANVSNSGLSGRAFFDTDDLPLAGRIIKKLPDPTVERVAVNLPAGFKANDRLVRWPGDPTTIEQCLTFPFPIGRVCTQVPVHPPYTRTGSITCPGGTEMRIEVAGSVPDPDIKGFLCD